MFTVLFGSIQDAQQYQMFTGVVWFYTRYTAVPNVHCVVWFYTRYTAVPNVHCVVWFYKDAQQYQMFTVLFGSIQDAQQYQMFTVLFDSTAHRLQDFDIHVYVQDPATNPSASGALCAHHDGPMGSAETKELVCCDGPIRGRFVRIANTPGQYLTLCEVQVMAVPAV